MAYKKVVIKGDPTQNEAIANAALSPGHLIELMSTGKVRKHATSGGDAAKMVAIENSLQGEDIDDAYSAGDVVQYVHLRPGDEAMIYLAQGQNVSIGDQLCSNGDGTLKKYTALDVAQSASGTIYVNAIVGIALEAKDLSTSSESDTRIKVLIA